MEYQNGFIFNLLWFIYDLWPKHIVYCNVWLEWDIDIQFILLDSVSSGLLPRLHRSSSLRLFTEDPVHYGYSQNVGFEEFPGQNDNKW